MIMMHYTKCYSVRCELSLVCISAVTTEIMRWALSAAIYTQYPPQTQPVMAH